MNIFGKVLSQLPLLPGIVQGIEAISQEAKSGASKKQMAMDSLGIATAVAGQVLPGDALAIQAASALASGAIDLIVKGFNTAGWFGHGVTPILPAPLVAPADTKPTAGNIRVIG